ncbi:hypothetical protein L6452_10110 [Arctium lappa]|uniref:Uncharacterized protein n=1 Tax=Arctium lappa TaxID=4217 RepID=A0ACB9DLQ0_ARCLA|nr:hypothetical protein L6452_10110 [Arctium lappa]
MGCGSDRGRVPSVGEKEFDGERVYPSIHGKAGLVGHVASTEKEKIKAYLKGLPSDMMTMVQNSNASNLRETIEDAQFMEEVYARGKPEKAVAVVEKRKWES